MYDCNKLSDNNVQIYGVLSEFEVIEDTSKASGKDYVRITAKVNVDQEIEGVEVNNTVTVKFLQMKLKKDGSPNPAYKRLVDYKDKFISLAAADDPSQASYVSITGSLEENAWFDAKTNKVKSSYQIRGGFMNEIKDRTKNENRERAKFNLSGVVGKMVPEMKQDEETGRLIVSFIFITWGGKANMVKLYASGSKRDFIEQNWNEQDTVNVTGYINSTFKSGVNTIEVGFGEAIEQPYTFSVNDLVISGGSPCGLEESRSYDIDSIKQACAERIEEQKALESAKSATTAAPKKNDLGF